MVGLVSTLTPGASFGVNTTLGWFRPDALTAADVHDMPLPSGVHGVNLPASWAIYRDQIAGAGAWTANIIVNRHLQVRPLGMRALDEVPTVALAAGPGITAEVIPYLRGYDAFSDERTPLGAAGATLNAANQKISYTGLNSLVLPARITHLEGWESRDGALPAFVWRRQVGVATVTHAVAFGDLGESETSDWQKPPRCRYVVTWHERVVMAGDDDNPTTIYFMEIGFPERWAGLTLNTRSQQPIVGLAEINGVLLVGCPGVTERVTGWTEDDLAINIVQPQRGLLSSQALVHVDNWLTWPTQEQMYVTDGSSWIPVMLDVAPVWSREVKAHRRAYEVMWAQHLRDERLVRFYAGVHTDVPNRYVFWVMDYRTLIPQEGGNLGQPLWSYDDYEVPATCAGSLAVPRGRRTDGYTGHNDGFVTVEGSGDQGYDSNTDGGQDEIQFDLITGAQQFGHVGGKDHGQQLTLDNFEVIARVEDCSLDVMVYSGDIECYAPLAVPARTTTIGPTADAGPPEKQATWTHQLGGEGWAAGRAFVFRFFSRLPLGIRFSGLVAWWHAGTSGRQDTDTSGGG